MSYVYAIGAINEGSIESVKIGVATDPGKRLSTLQTGNHRKLRLLYSIDVENSSYAYEIEKYLHDAFVKHRQNGEWFSCSNKKLFPIICQFFQGGIKDTTHNWQPSSFYDEGV